MKIGTYTQSQLNNKRKYIRKNKFNSTYKKSLTIRNKRLRDKRILMYMLAWFVITATYAFIDISNNFVISCDEVVKATSIATPERVEVETPLLEQVLPVMIETEKSNEMQIREIAKEFDFKWEDWLVKLAFCESSLNQYAVGDNGNSRGLFQIHKGYHPNVTDEQAFNMDNE